MAFVGEGCGGVKDLEDAVSSNWYRRKLRAERDRLRDRDQIGSLAEPHCVCNVCESRDLITCEQKGSTSKKKLKNIYIYIYK